MAAERKVVQQILRPDNSVDEDVHGQIQESTGTMDFLRLELIPESDCCQISQEVSIAIRIHGRANVDAQGGDEAVLLTNSMRRKLTINLAMVVFMLLLFSLSSFLGIVSYKRMVKDLKLSVTEIPRKDDLVSAISSLIKPLRFDFPKDSSSSSIRQEAFLVEFRHYERVFDEFEQRLELFRERWHGLPDSLQPSYAEKNSYSRMFETINDALDGLRDEQGPLYDLDYRAEYAHDVTMNVANLIATAEALPDPSNRLGERILEAEEDYRFHLRMVSMTGIVSLIMFSLLSYWTWKWIFSPIHRLTEGVEKISKGNYNYRLNVDTTCELSHLGQTFNKMAGKIEQDQREKEREIEERSKQLVISERLAGAGFLASGVAHEINNPLTVIMTAATGLRRRLEGEALSQLSEKDQKKVRTYLELIQSETERCERITKKLLDFSYGKADERNMYDVVAVAQEVAAMVGHLSKYQDRKVTVNRTEPLHAWVNGPEIKQVVLNLVANGLDACDSGGRVDVAVEELPDQIEITVTDDGMGMTADQQKKIFEPFFTTKQVGKGTGLGLSITHRIVVDHQGTLEVFSDGPGKGSKFTLRLPKTNVAANAA